MKKSILLLLCLLGLIQNVSAAGVRSGDPGDPIVLNLIGNDDETGSAGLPKSPDNIPTVSLDDHTLYFAEAFSEVVAIELKDANGTVVYSTNLPVGSSSVILPSTLSGNYTIYIIYISGYIYYGQISL